MKQDYKNMDLQGRISKYKKKTLYEDLKIQEIEFKKNL